MPPRRSPLLGAALRRRCPAGCWLTPRSSWPRTPLSWGHGAARVGVCPQSSPPPCPLLRLPPRALRWGRTFSPLPAGPSPGSRRELLLWLLPLSGEAAGGAAAGGARGAGPGAGKTQRSAKSRSSTWIGGAGCCCQPRTQGKGASQGPRPALPLPPHPTPRTRRCGEAPRLLLPALPWFGGSVLLWCPRGVSVPGAARGPHQRRPREVPES